MARQRRSPEIRTWGRPSADGGVATRFCIRPCVAIDWASSPIVASSKCLRGFIGDGASWSWRRSMMPPAVDPAGVACGEPGSSGGASPPRPSCSTVQSIARASLRAMLAWISVCLPDAMREMIDWSTPAERAKARMDCA